MKARKVLYRSVVVLLALLVIAAVMVPPSAHAAGKTHVVRRGENLTQIARRYGTTVGKLMRLNGLSNPNFIWVGQRLRVSGTGGSTSGASTSGGTIHVVRRGQNLAGIARKYGTSVGAIVSANGLRNANFIYTGQRLRIPKKGAGGSNTSGGGGSSTGKPPAGTGTKWIDVDLSSQTTRAMRGNTVVKKMVVSTGLARYPTPTGRFRVYAKYRSTPMSGPGYYLPGVPHTMYFYRGYALHGTYWHSNFGRRMSHGCINLKRSNAAWLFNWSPHGTLVVIHQ
ncbi:LysM peptidoglycan-binding domain-containing protein [Chloroflexota bacterium]